MSPLSKERTDDEEKFFVELIAEELKNTGNGPYYFSHLDWDGIVDKFNNSSNCNTKGTKYELQTLWRRLKSSAEDLRNHFGDHVLSHPVLGKVDILIRSYPSKHTLNAKPKLPKKSATMIPTNLLRRSKRKLHSADKFYEDIPMVDVDDDAPADSRAQFMGQWSKKRPIISKGTKSSKPNSRNAIEKDTVKADKKLEVPEKSRLPNGMTDTLKTAITQKYLIVLGVTPDTGMATGTAIGTGMATGTAIGTGMATGTAIGTGMATGTAIGTGMATGTAIGTGMSKTSAAVGNVLSPVAKLNWMQTGTEITTLPGMTRTASTTAKGMGKNEIIQGNVQKKVTWNSQVAYETREGRASFPGVSTGADTGMEARPGVAKGTELTGGFPSEVVAEFTVVNTGSETELGTNTAGMVANTAGIDANNVGMVANPAGMEENNAGMEENNVGMVANNAGTEENNVGMVANNVGMVANTAGMEENNVGMVANTAGMVANTAGMVANTAGIDANNVGMVANPAGMEANNAGMEENNVGMVANNAGTEENNVGMVANTAGMVANTVGMVASPAGKEANNAGMVNIPRLKSAVFPLSPISPNSVVYRPNNQQVIQNSTPKKTCILSSSQIMEPGKYFWQNELLPKQQQALLQAQGSMCETKIQGALLANKLSEELHETNLKHSNVIHSHIMQMQQCSALQNQKLENVKIRNEERMAEARQKLHESQTKYEEQLAQQSLNLQEAKLRAMELSEARSQELHVIDMETARLKREEAEANNKLAQLRLKQIESELKHLDNHRTSQ